MRVMARFNRRATNRLIGLRAPYVSALGDDRPPGPEERDDVSRTPVAAVIRGSTMTIPLPYGDDTDWVKNLLAARGGEVVRLGRAAARWSYPRLVRPRRRRPDQSGHPSLPHRRPRMTSGSGIDPISR